MSTQELQTVVTILKGILNPDNNTRKESEKKLSELNQNPSALSLCLSMVLVESSVEKGVKILASVLLRKVLHVPESDDVSQVWSNMSEEYKTSLKENILKSIINEADKSLKLKICDTMATIVENVFSSKESWPGVLDFIYQGISLPLEPNNISNIETVLFLLSLIFGIVYEEMISKLDAFIVTFESFFKYDSADLKTRTSQVIGEILSIVKKKDSKKFKIFIPSILEHTYKCLTDGKQEHNVSTFLIF